MEIHDNVQPSAELHHISRLFPFLQLSYCIIIIYVNVAL